MAMEFERIGYVNSFVCKYCKWMTVTVNLNNGTTSPAIGCNNIDQGIIDGISVEKASPFDEGSAEHPHIAVNMGYNPMPGWFQEVSERTVNINAGSNDTEKAMRMWAERVWIRPTVRHIENVTNGDQKLYDHIYKNCKKGHLLLADMGSDFDRAEPFTGYGRDQEETQAYLDSIYCPSASRFNLN